MFLVFFFKNLIEYIYKKYNQSSITRKRDFNELSYFEKLFLILFHRKNIFKNSIANIFTNNNLFNTRKKKYPLIFFFHLYYDRMDYKFDNLKSLNKFYKYFLNSEYFNIVFKKYNRYFFKNNNNYLNFLIIQKVMYKRYYNLCSSIYFSKYNNNNLVKLNLLFFVFLKNSKNKFILYDLSKYTDWYDYNFKINKKLKKKYKEKRKLTSYEINFKKYREKKFFYIKNIYYKYYDSFKKVYKHLNDEFKHMFIMNYKILNVNKIKLNVNWLNKIKLYYPIRFSESSLSKYIDLKNTKNYLFFYIRKNRIFNKGRYSRNRQLYRTGVYWCLWLNIILVYGLYFLFYRFTFNFGYFWWGILILAYSTIFSRILKYNFINIFYVKNEFIEFFKWFGLIFYNLRVNFYSILIYFYKKFFYKNLFNNNVFYVYLLKILSYFSNVFKVKNYKKFIYLWESLSFKERSVFSYKHIIHWFVQFYKLMTY